MKVYGETEVGLHSFSTSTLVLRRGQLHARSVFTRSKETFYPLRLGGTQFFLGNQVPNINYCIHGSDIENIRLQIVINSLKTVTFFP